MLKVRYLVYTQITVGSQDPGFIFSLVSGRLPTFSQIETR